MMAATALPIKIPWPLLLHWQVPIEEVMALAGTCVHLLSLRSSVLLSILLFHEHFCEMPFDVLF